MNKYAPPWRAITIFLILFNIILAKSTKSTSPLGFPKVLNDKNFAKEISQGLHVIDFFSPYCSHCKTLQPIWEEAWKTFQVEGKGLKIHFNQVNCIESADLCFDEKISYFPSIRLYGPSGYIKNFPFNSKRTVRNLIDFAKEEVSVQSNWDTLDNVNNIEILNTTQLKEIINSTSTDEPYLISFWPPLDPDSTEEFEAFEDCDDCVPFQRTWKLIAQEFISSNINISIGYFDCGQDHDICKQLGFTSLVKNTFIRKEHQPKVIMVLPNNKQIINFNEDFTLDPTPYKEFAKRIYQNYQLPFISVDDVDLIKAKELDFPQSSLKPFPIQKHHLIYIHDSNSPNDVSLQIIDQLQELSNIPNIYIYKISLQDSNLAMTRNNQNNLFSSLEFQISADIYNSLVSSSTNSPKFMFLNDGDFLPKLLFPNNNNNNNNNNNIPDREELLSFIERNVMQSFIPLTGNKFDAFIDLNDNYPNTFTIQLINTTDVRTLMRSNRAIQKFQTIKFDFQRTNILTKNEQYLKKSKNINSPLSSQSYLEEFFNEHFLTTYIDLALQPKLLQRLGIYLNKKPKIGDVIIINRKTKNYYTADINNNAFNPYNPTQLLDGLKDVVLQLPTSSLKGNSLNSPLVNIIPRFSILFYLMIFCLIILLWKFKKFINLQTKRNISKEKIH
ncbi:hypothetical protein TBLA_0J01710 [Henningerozyma blattae CBS 6284]|uniref:Thioredoxin domain-containing protein n=1 Tax=Henningerozyma blattae (strain ATCC 34711 / CBS 6284 / DSM 70876 / NBRC 10599 / NRRL Y-10934 / UCD 77-7) TaxID=1071380 RepID=I2H9W3_HENB6|nr:hypothetical protein TBLA_0J01710 [Tetrapisispora blattae CBS 6284]CCH63165.1 hypothetical protein TBLA_0J01710 [Tetrapisispora blattae CBS 6284]